MSFLDVPVIVMGRRGVLDCAVAASPVAWLGGGTVVADDRHDAALVAGMQVDHPFTEAGCRYGLARPVRATAAVPNAMPRTAMRAAS